MSGSVFGCAVKLNLRIREFLSTIAGKLVDIAFTFYVELAIVENL